MFNDELAAILAAFGENHDDINLFEMDVFSLINLYQVETQEWIDLFWEEDFFHPSAVGHDIIFREAAAAIGEPVPEPATVLLLGLGIQGVAGISRKNSNRSA